MKQFQLLLASCTSHLVMITACLFIAMLVGKKVFFHLKQFPR